MWTRAELKERAKASIRQNYWQCLLVCILFAILSGNFITIEYDTVYNDVYLAFGSGSATYPFLGISLTMAGVLGVIGILWAIFVLNPLTVGKHRYFLENREEVSGIDALFYTFKQKDYFNIVLILFLSDLFIFLWTLLLIIPGIYKIFQYTMISYILAENPGISSSRVFQMTKEMTAGIKFDIFVLGLSFILWDLLGIFTCGIVSIAIMPYKEATYAELYIAVRDEYIEAGYSDYDELPGFYRE